MELTAAQITALKDGHPVTVTPPELGERCVVLREDVYDRIRAALEPGTDFDARETYPAVLKVLDQTDESPEQYRQYAQRHASAPSTRQEPQTEVCLTRHFATQMSCTLNAT